MNYQTDLFSFRNQNCFQIKELLAIQYFSQQTLVSLDKNLRRGRGREEQEKKVKFALSETAAPDQREQVDEDDRNDQYSIMKERRKNKNISPLLR